LLAIPQLYRAAIGDTSPYGHFIPLDATEELKVAGLAARCKRIDTSETLEPGRSDFNRNDP
jgi:hypothetical protein